jgi:hypothetical protein
MGSLEHRQATAMQQVVHQRRDENRLAGPRQPGNAQSQGRLDQIARPVCKRVKGNQGLVGKTGNGR